MRRILSLFLGLALLASVPAYAQNQPGSAAATPVQLANSFYSLVPLSATAAVTTPMKSGAFDFCLGGSAAGEEALPQALTVGIGAPPASGGGPQFAPD